jgi:cellulose synthase/poly-beta-1,6-N-acetylglucosamine synthase-like glycosyltransferase
MAFLIVIMILLLAGYAVLIETYRYWFLKIPLLKKKAALDNKTNFTVIIPARNEADGIIACLHTVLSQNYPANLYEVIVIDDHSTDETVSKVEALKQQYKNLRLLELHKIIDLPITNSYKKKAIEIAIRYAKGDYIVTTDADCVVLTNWLSCFDEMIQNKPSVFIAAPVKFRNTGSFVSVFQCLDFLSLQGISAASVHMPLPVATTCS